MIPFAVYGVTLHSSLQHEVLHGHPTRNARLNELLVALPVGLFIPYRRFKSTHLRHHNNEALTDPYDDPESWYVAAGDWRRLSRPMRLLLAFNTTLLGRLLVGPALGIAGLVRHDARAIARGDRAILKAWLLHLAGLFVMLALLIGVFAVDPLSYALLVAYPGLSLLMLRTFAEHRIHRDPARRSAIIEASPLFSLLYLNNNLHYLHHKWPSKPWYELGALYRAEKERLLQENGGYAFPGYGALFRRYLLRRIGPVVHPLRRRTTKPKQ